MLRFLVACMGALLLVATSGMGAVNLNGDDRCVVRWDLGMHQRVCGVRGPTTHAIVSITVEGGELTAGACTATLSAHVSSHNDVPLNYRYRLVHTVDGVDDPREGTIMDVMGGAWHDQDLTGNTFGVSASVWNVVHSGEAILDMPNIGVHYIDDSASASIGGSCADFEVGMTYCHIDGWLEEDDPPLRCDVVTNLLQAN